MRIALDATALYGRYGGVEYSLWNLLSALRVEDQINEYCVYIPRDGPPPKLTKPFPSRWRWIRLPFCGREKLRRILWQQTVLPFRLRKDKCDLLHAPTYVAPILNSYLKPRVPCVLTVYDLIALEFPRFATRLNRWHYRALLRPSIRGARRVLAPSQAVQKSIGARVPGAKNKTRVVPLGLEEIFFQTPSTRALEEVRARYELPENFLLFVGNFEPKKNLGNILKALELIPDAPLLIIAGGARAWENVPSTPRAKTIGYVPRKDLPALYSMCAAFVFPSFAEGFGLPVLEALASGAPVVSSTRVPLPNLENVALLCDPNSPESIAAELERVISDGHLCVLLNMAGEEYARPFTWQHAARATLEIYRELAP